MCPSPSSFKMTSSRKVDEVRPHFYSLSYEYVSFLLVNASCLELYRLGGKLVESGSFWESFGGHLPKLWWLFGGRLGIVWGSFGGLFR